MSLGPWEIAMIGVGGTILGSITGAVLTYRFQLSRAYRTAFNAEAKQFREAFIKQLIVFSNRENTTGLYDTINTPLLTDHFPAMIRFRVILKRRAVRQFYRAWQDYAGHKKIKFSLTDEPPFPMPSVEQYHDRLEHPQDGTNEQEECRQEVIRKLERLLSFAKPK